MNIGINSTLSAAIGANIAVHRKKRGLTLSGLSEISTVSKASLSALENGRSSPSLGTVWRLADALGVAFGDLIGDHHNLSISNEDGMRVRLIERQRGSRPVETFLIEVPSGTSRVAEAHPAGVKEHVTVLNGNLATGPKSAPTLVAAGSSIEFAADVPHIYKSASELCLAIVTIVYPPNDGYTTIFDQDLSWPQDDDFDSWELVRDLVARARIEVQNGCSLSRVTFHSCTLSPQYVVSQLKTKIISENKTIQTILSGSPVPTVSIVYRSKKMHSLIKGDALAGPLVERCRLLSDLAVNPFDLRVASAPSLHKIVLNASTMIEGALAAELLTRRGDPTVPKGVKSRISSHSDHSGCEGRLFEDRIDVDAYEAYELLHPAYARQVLAIAESLPSVSSQVETEILDVGTGPGLPLQMLLELRPDLRAVAVDPSETAFFHFQHRFGADSRVRGINKSITNFCCDGEMFPNAISVGASHHLDTHDFFESVRACLQPEGYLIVSDEMISPFNNTRERVQALITHHLWYIVDTIFDIPGDVSLPDKKLSEIIGSKLPTALVLAIAGKITESVRLVREAYEEANSLILPAYLSVNLAAFPRFHLLELQALVAGLDYEVEQKTHAKRFISLAETSGFKCKSHARLYATAGDGEMDAGTHLFVLERD